MNGIKLSQEIMNLQTGDIDGILKKINLDPSSEIVRDMLKLAYKIGHRDARHAAAELALKP